MNVVIVPFHDWRKILIEGFRTRDAHFIEEFEKKNKLCIIINRPTTIFEILLFRRKNLIKGKVIFSRRNFKLYRESNNLYVIDYISNDIFGQLLNRYKWFTKQYGNSEHISFIKECLNILGVDEDYYLLSQNIFAFKLSENLNPILSVFDAWDNFTKFKVYSKLKDDIIKGYKTYSKNCDFWITNSKDNILDFNIDYTPNAIHLIKNGVDVSRFVNSKSIEMPIDMKDIPRPIVGFGGKISHLIDVKLLNETMLNTKEASFVFVGQILNKRIFKEILKTNNFYYLGDKHYDVYPNYVKNFDVCIVPYVIDEEKKSGANSIKVYEYLSMHKKVIGTNSNGLEDLEEYLFIVNNSKEFSKIIKDGSSKKTKINLKTHSWDTKVSCLINLLKRRHENN